MSYYEQPAMQDEPEATNKFVPGARWGCLLVKSWQDVYNSADTFLEIDKKKAKNLHTVRLNIHVIAKEQLCNNKMRIQRKGLRRFPSRL